MIKVIVSRGINKFGKPINYYILKIAVNARKTKENNKRHLMTMQNHWSHDENHNCSFSKVCSEVESLDQKLESHALAAHHHSFAPLAKR